MSHHSKVKHVFPPHPKQKPLTTHNWDTDAVLEAAREWPDSTPINWTAFARKHNVPGRNCGQVVNEYLAKQGVDVLKLEHHTAARVRPRWQLLKSFGIVHPAHTQ